MSRRAGDENLFRVGIDDNLGAREQGALWLRDDSTGQRYVGISGTSEPGFAFQFDVDLVRVESSAWLPAGGPAAESWRPRMRSGMARHNELIGIFYGVTWLSSEFVGQPEGLVPGSVRFGMNF